MSIHVPNARTVTFPSCRSIASQRSNCLEAPICSMVRMASPGADRATKLAVNMTSFFFSLCCKMALARIAIRYPPSGFPFTDQLSGNVSSDGKRFLNHERNVLIEEMHSGPFQRPFTKNIACKNSLFFIHLNQGSKDPFDSVFGDCMPLLPPNCKRESLLCRRRCCLSAFKRSDLRRTL